MTVTLFESFLMSNVFSLNTGLCSIFSSLVAPNLISQSLYEVSLPDTSIILLTRTSADLLVGVSTSTLHFLLFFIIGINTFFAKCVVLPVPGGPKTNSIFSHRFSCILKSSSYSNLANCLRNSSNKNAGLLASIVADVTELKSISSIASVFFIFTRSVYDLILATSIAIIFI